MTVIESRSTFRSYVATIASMFTHLISRWSRALKRSDQSQMETDSCFECASMPITYRGSSPTSRLRCCFFVLIVLPYACCRVLEQAGCKVAFKYPGSFAPSRWFPPALKHHTERGPFGLAQRGSRASPMRTASGYQPPAVPYHTPIRGSLSTPCTIPFQGNAQYITNTTGVCPSATPFLVSFTLANGPHFHSGRPGKKILIRAVVTDSTTSVTSPPRQVFGEFARHTRTVRIA